MSMKRQFRRDLKHYISKELQDTLEEDVLNQIITCAEQALEKHNRRMVDNEPESVKLARRKYNYERANKRHEQK